MEIILPLGLLKVITKSSLARLNYSKLDTLATFYRCNVLYRPESAFADFLDTDYLPLETIKQEKFKAWWNNRIILFMIDKLKARITKYR